ncbi:hypothetical protein SLEP1_g46057 [Rubroshorea leprosula]|nr:hypothetical protein SLEP1_g46057 [Rubroshorea leprosula]
MPTNILVVNKKTLLNSNILHRGRMCKRGDDEMDDGMVE